MAEAVLMRRDLSTPFAEPIWPDGIALAPFSETMAEDLHGLLVAAYAKGEGEVTAFARWWNALTQDPEYDAELVHVAQAANGALVGLAHCRHDAVVQDLAVRPGWRRRGIGEALILRAFEAARNRYHDHLDVKVPRGDPAAMRLCRRLGMVALPERR